MTGRSDGTAAYWAPRIAPAPCSSQRGLLSAAGLDQGTSSAARHGVLGRISAGMHVLAWQVRRGRLAPWR
jgi:hypothetical protein